MGITVKEVLKIDSLKNCKVIAGNNGLDRVIEYVDIFEVPDIINWLRRGLMLLTTGYATKEDPNYLVNIIESMAENNCAALFIKDSRFLHGIPQSMIDKANELSFPVILIPNEVPYIEITHPIMNHILMYNHKENKLKENMMQLLTNSSIMGEDIIISILKEIDENFTFKPPYFLGILENNIDEYGTNTRINCHIKLNRNIIYTKFNSTNTFIISSSYNNLRKNLKNILFEDNSTCDNSIILISNPMKSLTEIKDRYYELTELLKIIKVCPKLKDKKIIYYEDILHYILLHKINDQKQTMELVNNALDPLLKLEENEKDVMLYTLYHYVSSLGNKSKASRNAYMHRNTFNYRMDKLTKLLNSDLTSEEEIYKYKIILDMYFLMDK